MERIIKAFYNSMRALDRLARGEKAVQQELVLLVLALPMGWFIAPSWATYALLIGSLLLLLLVEVLNTGIEATCDALTREFNPDIQLAKDCGSLAVLIASIMAGGTWLFVIAARLWGLA